MIDAFYKLSFLAFSLSRPSSTLRLWGCRTFATFIDTRNHCKEIKNTSQSLLFNEKR